jgi:hypothetical protein
MQHRHHFVRSLGVGLAAAVSALAITSCSGGGESNAVANGPTTTIVSPGSAKISAFDVPAKVQCGTTPSTTVHVTYATSGGKSQQLLVDGRAVPLTAPTGSVDTPVHCDPIEHTFVLYVLDEAKRPTTQTKYLATDLPSP